jgi:cell division protein FtsB
MKAINPIEENQKLKSDVEYERQKRKEAEKENMMLRKEIAELKKNLDAF